MMTRIDMNPEIRTLLYDVYDTGKDIESLLWRMSDDPAGPITEDEIANMLEGILELHKTRCRILQQRLDNSNNNNDYDH